MKTHVATLVLSCVAVAPVSAQQLGAAQVPGGVRQAFQAKFPGAAPARWQGSGAKGYVAEFSLRGSPVQATFAATGVWQQTSTEIGAINLPLAVRTDAVRAYRGFQFVETRQLVRATDPVQVFEIHFAKPGDTVTVQYEASGKVFHSTTVLAARAPAPRVVTDVTGTWLGESKCLLPGHSSCRDEPVIYRITTVSTDTTGFDIQMNRVVNGVEESTGMRACTLVTRSATLYCSMALGTWKFRVTADSLVGGFTLANSTRLSRVAVRRQR